MNLMANIAKSFPINTNYECKNTVLIAGVGRSGTTWLGNIVNHSNCFRDIFEPFRPDHTEVWKNYHYKQYVQPTCQDKELFKAAQYILSGRVNNKWCNRFNKKTISSKRMVKEIRANFFKGDKKSREQIIKILEDINKEDAMFNIVGKKSVQVALEAGVISKEGIITIQGVPIALGLL